MIWTEMLLGLGASPESLRTAIALALSLPAHDVEVVESIDDASPSSPVVAEHRDVRGEFPLHVSLYVRSTPPTVAVVEVAQSVAASVSTSVLISDDAPNPYSMTLVVPTGTTATVYLDIEALDSDGAYVVVQRPPTASERSEVPMQRALDGRKIGTEDDFHLELCQVLEMGPYYGRNLNALGDRLSTDIERPITLVWTFSGESRRRMGPVFEQIVEILEAVKQQDAGFNWKDRFDYRLE